MYAEVEFFQNCHGICLNRLLSSSYTTVSIKTVAIGWLQIYAQLSMSVSCMKNVPNSKVCMNIKLVCLHCCSKGTWH